MINRSNIVLNMKDPYDYEEFLHDCKQHGIDPLPALEYAQKVGMLLFAIRRYPDSTPLDAYLRLVTSGGRVISVHEKTGHIGEQPSPTKKCCGGGKVR